VLGLDRTVSRQGHVAFLLSFRGHTLESVKLVLAVDRRSLRIAVEPWQSSTFLPRRGWRDRGCIRTAKRPPHERVAKMDEAT